MPEDNTPPSRFVRAVVWTRLARKFNDAVEGIYETYRILDNFQLSFDRDSAYNNIADDAERTPELMCSSTIWTTAWNLTDLILNYHTQNNRCAKLVILKSTFVLSAKFYLLFLV
jgi:choloylglycine hydrolase